MPHRGIALVREVQAALKRLSEEFPDFHHLSVEGQGVLRRHLYSDLAIIFVGRDTDITHGDGSEEGVPFFYGDDLSDGFASLCAIGDELVKALRAIQIFSNSKPPIPIVRGDAAPYIYAGAILEMGDVLPGSIRDSFSELGVEVTITGFPTVHKGKATVGEEGRHLIFPGEVLARQPYGYKRWSQLKTAISQGEFSITYSLLPFFDFAAHLMEAFAVLHDEMEKVEQSAAQRPEDLGSFRLGEIGERPFVNGKFKTPLTAAQHDTIKALVDAKSKGVARLTGPELDQTCGHTDARKYLKDLTDGDADWRSVILFPRHKGDGYGVT